MVNEKVSVIDVKGELTAFAEGVLMQAYIQDWHRTIREWQRGWVAKSKWPIHYPHTPAKNPRPVSWKQAYIAYLLCR
jgi:hypothetical protein